MGKNVLVAPVVEAGATSRHVYPLPAGWYDFRTGEHLEGGQEIERPVDLETRPLFIRAGSILPLGPVKQFVDEKVDGPLMLSIYPGADASFLLYEDDGRWLNHRKGEWMGTEITWNDRSRKLDLRLAAGSRMLSSAPRAIEIRLSGVTKDTKNTVFHGTPASVSF